jgi:hypothetical protein
MQHAFGHLGIAVDSLVVSIPLFLHLPGFDDPFTDGGTTLARLHLGELLEGYYWHFDVKIDTIEDFRGQ